MAWVVLFIRLRLLWKGSYQKLNPFKRFQDIVIWQVKKCNGIPVHPNNFQGILKQLNLYGNVHQQILWGRGYFKRPEVSICHRGHSEET